MSSEVAICTRGLSKCYPIFDRPENRLKQMFARGRRKYYREFWALRNIDLEVYRGETVGIIGRNGSGKSTLLQTICGTLTATTGELSVNGRVAALLELGAGFDPEFTGRENVYTNGAVLGLTKKEIDTRFDNIVAFADIGEFIDQKVKTYSSGMYVRLAFAVIAHVDADILIIDEALSVGDVFFVQKCMRFLRKFMERGTLLFCSHDTSAIVNLCSRAALLDQGRITMVGTAKQVTEQYLADLYESEQGESRIEATQSESTATEEDYRDMREAMINASRLRNDIEIFKFDPDEAGFGAGAARIISVTLRDKDGVPLSWVVGGEDVTLEIRCKASNALARPIIGFLFRDRLGQAIFGDNTFAAYQFNTPSVKAGEEFTGRFGFRLPTLPSGDYSVSAAIADGSQDSHVQHHWMHDALIVRAHGTSVCHGLIGLPMKSIRLITPAGSQNE